jgi:hypothetical protein
MSTQAGGLQYQLAKKKTAEAIHCDAQAVASGWFFFAEMFLCLIGRDYTGMNINSVVWIHKSYAEDSAELYIAFRQMVQTRSSWSACAGAEVLARLFSGLYIDASANNSIYSESSQHTQTLSPAVIAIALHSAIRHASKCFFRTLYLLLQVFDSDECSKCLPHALAIPTICHVYRFARDNAPRGTRRPRSLNK